MQHFQFVIAFIAVLLWQLSNPGFSVTINEYMTVIVIPVLFKLTLANCAHTTVSLAYTMIKD